jgi:hypothetical protein
MQYLRLRGQLYYQTLKQLLTALIPLFTLLMMVLYLAIPVLMLTALVSISVIADINTSLEQRLIYQGLYFLLLYLMIRVQKRAIVASAYQYYLASLPVRAPLKLSATVLLTLIAGNLPLLTPVFLLGHIADWHAAIEQLHFVLFALSCLLIGWVSINNQSFPWCSLMLLPVIGIFILNTRLVSANQLNSLWLILIIGEAYLQPFNYMTKKIALGLSLSKRSYWQFRWLGIVNNPVNVLSRIFIVLFFIALVAYMQRHLGQIANDQIQCLVGYIAALIIGSYQFDNESFYRKYRHYLASLLASHRYRYWLDILPVMLLATLVAMICVVTLDFSIYLLLLLPGLSLLTCICVSKMPRIFFMPPTLIIAGLMFAVNA